MAPNPKVAKACKAMKDMGISQETGKAVLKRLLKLYDNKWNLIEDENYRVLLDSVFEYEEAKVQYLCSYTIYFFLKTKGKRNKSCNLFIQRHFIFCLYQCFLPLTFN